MTKQWIVRCWEGSYSAQHEYGPYSTVDNAAHGAPLFYSVAIVLPVIDGIVQCVEDNQASALFSSIRKSRIHATDPILQENHRIGRVT